MNRQAQDDADAKVKALSLTVRKQYIEDHPGIRPHIKAAILDERPVIGMTDEQVVAAFTLWGNFSVPTWQKYKSFGAVGTWRFQKRNESKWNSRADQWVLFGNPRGTGRVDDGDLQAIMINFLDNSVTEWNDPGEVLKKDTGNGRIP